MIDRTGRVIVNPRMGMGVQDFQRLYMGEGRSPQEAASFIHLNYPMEAKSFMEKQWQNLGMKDSPERYFSNPANLTMLDGGTDLAIKRTNDMMGPTRVMPQAAARMAPSMGAIANSGAAGSNIAKLSLLQLLQEDEKAGRVLEAQPMQQVRDSASREVPLPMDGMSDRDLLRSQTAGDNGFIRKFLARQSGIEDYGQWLQKPMANPDWMERDPRYRSDTDIKPYRGAAGPLTPGYGRLDTTVFGDKEFQELYARDPEAASYAYSRLTGRALKGDYDETMKLRKDNIEGGRRYAQKALEDGAQYNPADGRWYVWNLTEAPDNANPLQTTQPRPFRQRSRATDDQQYWLNQHYASIMGRPLDNAPKFGAREARDIMRLGQSDKELGDKIKAEETRMGGPLLPAEIQKIKHDVDVARIASQHPSNDGFIPQAQRGIERGFRIITGQADDDVIERGNSPIVDFMNEYFGTSFGNKMVDEIINGRRTGRRITVPANSP